MKRTQLILSATAVILALSIMIGCKKKSNYTPAIYVKGGDMTIPLNSTFSDPGATAQDDEDGELTDKIEVDQSELDVNQVGSYNIVYKVIDSDGNESEASRIVTVANDAQTYFGYEFTVFDTAGTGASSIKDKYLSTIQVSKTKNNEISFARFNALGGYGTNYAVLGEITATVSYTSINFSYQALSVRDESNGNAIVTHYIKGIGKKIQYASTPALVTEFNYTLKLDYTDSIPGDTVIKARAWYKLNG